MRSFVACARNLKRPMLVWLKKTSSPAATRDRISTGSLTPAESRGKPFTPSAQSRSTARIHRSSTTARRSSWPNPLQLHAAFRRRGLSPRRAAARNDREQALQRPLSMHGKLGTEHPRRISLESLGPWQVPRLQCGEFPQGPGTSVSRRVAPAHESARGESSKQKLARVRGAGRAASRFYLHRLRQRSRRGVSRLAGKANDGTLGYSRPSGGRRHRCGESVRLPQGTQTA